MSKGKEIAKKDDVGEELFQEGEEQFNSLLQPARSADELRGLVSDGGFTAEQFVSIPEGAGIEGYFFGKGAPVLMNDPQSREPNAKRSVDTWRIRHKSANVIMTIADSAQLSGKLGALPLGCYVIVEKRGQRRVGSRMVNDWAVLHNAAKRIPVPTDLTDAGTLAQANGTAARA